MDNGNSLISCPCSINRIFNIPSQINYNHHSKLRQLVHETHRFTRKFADTIEEHPLLVYMSALPFAPTNTLLYHTFHEPDLYPTIAGGFEQSWSRLMLVMVGHSSTVDSVALCSDGKLAASGSGDQTIRVWDLSSGATVLPALQGHTGTIRSVAFSPNGRLLVSGSEDKTVRLWDTVSGLEVIPAMRGHEDTVSSVIFSSDGYRILSADSYSGAIRVWDVKSGDQLLSAPIQHRIRIQSLAFSLDGSQIITVHSNGIVRVYNSASGAEEFEPIQGPHSTIVEACLSSDRKFVVSASSDKTLRIWGAKTGAEISPVIRMETDICSIAIAPDGNMFISGLVNGTMRAWDVNSSVELFSLQGSGYGYAVLSIAFSPDGRKVISGSVDQNLHIWDLTLTTVDIPSSVQGHKGAVISLVFSQDGSKIVSGSEDSTVRVWDSESADQIAVLHTNQKRPVRTVAISPDGGRVISGLMGGNVLVGTTELGTQIMRQIFKHEHGVICVIFSHDGLRVISSGGSDSNAYIWDSSSGVPVLPPLRGHSRPVSSLALSLDGERIVSGSYDKTVRVWEASSGKQTHVFLDHQDAVRSVSFSPDGLFIASLSFTECISWDLVTKGRVYLPEEYTRGWSTSMVRTTDSWIVELANGRFLTKLPSILIASHVIGYERSLAAVTSYGQVIIIHFPPALFSSSDIRLVGRTRQHAYATE